MNDAQLDALLFRIETLTQRLTDAHRLPLLPVPQAGGWHFQCGCGHEILWTGSHDTAWSKQFSEHAFRLHAEHVADILRPERTPE